MERNVTEIQMYKTHAQMLIFAVNSISTDRILYLL